MSLPSDAAQAASLLQRLCPADGWQLPAAQPETPGAAPLIGPLPAQQAATASVLLHDILGMSVGDKTAADCIVRFGLACTATLSRLMKPHQADKAVSTQMMPLFHLAQPYSYSPH